MSFYHEAKYAPRRMHRIFGTEDDKVNCSFYFKIGACRHGERCSRLHMKPNFSQTILLAHFYIPPPPDKDDMSDEDEDNDLSMIPNIPHNNKRVGKENYSHYENFYEDVLNELTKYGEIEEFVVCENLGDHMFGNTYVKFVTEEHAAKALLNLRGRYYAGRIIQAEYSPVTDFREGRCRQFDEDNCQRGGYCNFLHLKKIPRFARRYLQKTRDRARYQHLKKKKNKSDEWEDFPIRGDSVERRRCLKKWNELYDKQKGKRSNLISTNILDINNNNNSTSDNNNNNENNNNNNLPLNPPQTTSNAFPFMNPERLAMINGIRKN